MAHINRKILGSIKGKIGDVIFRERNGKVIAFARAKKYKKTKSQKLKKERTKFATVVQFANLIKNEPDLYSIWKKSNLPGSNAYQKIIKNNLKLTNESELSVNNILLPSGIDIEVNLLNINRSKNKISELEIELDIDNDHKPLFQEAKLYSLFYKTNECQLTSGEDKFYFNQTRINLDIESEKNIVKIPAKIKTNENCSLVLLLCLVSENKNKKIYWTSTKGITII